MKLVFVDESWEDYLYWQKTDKQKVRRINELFNLSSIILQDSGRLYLNALRYA